MRRLAIALTTMLLFACSHDDGPGSGLVEAGLEQVTGVVTAAGGGTLRFPNGTSIAFPPGAVKGDTTVTFSRVADTAYDPDVFLGAVKLEPDSLKLDQPATLTLRYGQAPLEGTEALLLVGVSKMNDLRYVGGEVNPYETVRAAIDPSTRTVTASVSHFSWWSLFPLPLLHLALELPGKYLHNGDILFTLTGAVNHTDASAAPMHIGVFVQDATHDTVVESTLPDPECTPGHFQGVDKHGYVGKEVTNHGRDGFKTLCGGHLFFGARKPYGDQTDAMRQKAADAALKRIGEPYGIATLNWPGWGKGTFGWTGNPITFGQGVSCVELAEDAWEDAGVNLSLIPDELLIPQVQFNRTTPVASIRAHAGDEIRIPVVGASRKPDSELYQPGRLSTAAGWRVPMVLRVTAEPDVFGKGRAKLENTASPQALQDLVFRPTNDDAAEMTKFTFELESPSEGRSLKRPMVLYVEVERVEGTCSQTLKPTSGNAWTNGMYFGDLKGSVGGASISKGGNLDVARMTGEVGGPFELRFEVKGSAPDYLGEVSCVFMNVPDAQFAPGASFSPAGECWYYCPNLMDGVNATAVSATFEVSSDCRTVTMALTATAPACSYVGSFTGVISNQ